MNSILSSDALGVISGLIDDEQPTPAVAAPRPFWQTEPCPAWCTNRHEDSDQHGDRSHWAPVASVDLALYTAKGGEGEYGSGELLIGATQHYRAAEPEIDLTVPTTRGTSYIASGEQGVRMSVDEARAVRDQLSQLLGLIDGDALDVELVDQGDGRARVSAEQTISFNAPFESGDYVRAHLTQWTEQDSPPELEVTIEANVTVWGCTPDQARDAAAQLRIAADRIDALAAVAEGVNARLAEPGRCRPWCTAHDEASGSCFAEPVVIDSDSQLPGVTPSVRAQLAADEDGESVHVDADGADLLTLDPDTAVRLGAALVATGAKAVEL